LRALAVSSAQPSALLPDLPTIAASGLPGYEAVSPAGVFAPARTPAALISRLNAEIVRALGAADARQKLLGAGIEVVGSTPAEMAALVKSDVAKWGKLIRDAGIRTE
jgi:tripartite-type tricarboxylate transporter receptor subunit TctC